MPTTPDQIDLLLAARTEHQQLEFKEATNQYDTRKLSEYCVAIANEGGGKLLLGIADQPPRRVTGSKAFSNTVDIAEKIFNWIGFRVDVEEVNPS